jgi:hypothetical protein
VAGCEPASLTLTFDEIVANCVTHSADDADSSVDGRGVGGVDFTCAGAWRVSCLKNGLGQFDESGETGRLSDLVYDFGLFLFDTPRMNTRPVILDTSSRSSCAVQLRNVQKFGGQIGG